MVERPLRPEAMPFSWDSLHESQKEGFRRIVGAMAQAARMIERASLAGAGSTAKSGSTAAEDSQRTSHTLLLSGERGTGKTSVLFTVERTINNAKWRTENFKGIDTDPCWADLSKLIEAGVVWLERLDMDPLPRSTNLLAAILLGSTGRWSPSRKQRTARVACLTRWSAGKRR